MKLVRRSWRDVFELVRIRFKSLLRDKYCMYWTLFFPMLFSLLTMLAAGGISAPADESKIPVAVCIENQEWKDLKDYLNHVKNSDGVNVFTVQELTEEEAKEKLLDKEIYGFIDANKTIKVYVDNLHEKEMIIESVVKQYTQVHHCVWEANLVTNANNRVEHAYIEDTLSQNATLYFAALGLACVLGMMWGIKIVTELFGHKNATAARRKFSSIGVWNQLLCDSLIAIILHWMELLCVMFLVIQILDLSYTKVHYVCLTIFLGSVVSVLAGEAYALVSNAGFQKAANNVSAMTIFCGLLAGMVIPQAKYYVQENLTFLCCLNPIQIVSDACYSVYYGERMMRYLTNILLMLAAAIVFFFIICIKVRRKQYETL